MPGLWIVVRGERFALVHLINLLDVFVSIIQMSQDCRKGISERLGSGYARSKVSLGELDRVHKRGFKTAVDLWFPGVVFRIGALPTIVVNRVVQRLRSVSRIVPHPAHIERDIASQELLLRRSFRSGAI